MTFTYSGDPSTSTRNYVRFLISDTTSTDALFSDEELNYVITEWGGDAYSAARELAEVLIARFSRLADSSSKSVGDISVRLLMLRLLNLQTTESSMITTPMPILEFTITLTMSTTTV